MVFSSLVQFSFSSFFCVKSTFRITKKKWLKNFDPRKINLHSKLRWSKEKQKRYKTCLWYQDIGHLLKVEIGVWAEKPGFSAGPSALWVSLAGGSSLSCCPCPGSVWLACIPTPSVTGFIVVIWGGWFSVPSLFFFSRSASIVCLLRPVEWVSHLFRYVIYDIFKIYFLKYQNIKIIMKNIKTFKLMYF